jgi:hypothetical protein
MPETTDRDAVQALASTCPTSVQKAGAAPVTSPCTRREVRQRAITLADTTWTWRTKYDSFSDGTARPTGAQGADKPSQLVGDAEGTAEVGIPYNWGGFDSPWSHTDQGDWATWAAALTKYPDPSKGPLVGKTNTGCDPVKYPGKCSGGSPLTQVGYYVGSAGIDCSGFVSAAASISQANGTKPGTRWLSDNTWDWGSITGIGDHGPLDIQPMNFFVSGSHTFYYEYGMPDATGLSTLEAVVLDAGNDGAQRNTRTWLRVVSEGFTNYRSWWDKQNGDSPAKALPLTTLSSGQLTYGRGQSIWYRFTITGPRNVLLTNILGGDADLYIYNASLGFVKSSNQGANDSEAVRLDVPNTYYARVFSYAETNSTGISYTIQIPTPVAAGTYDDTSSAVQYDGSWTHSNVWPRAYGGTQSWAITFDTKFRMTFTGSRITYRYSKVYNRGDAYIYLDGNYVETISSYSPDTIWQAARTWSVTPGVHTIEVRVAGDGFVDLDSFVVDIPIIGGGIYDDTHSRFQYIGGWTLGTATTGAAGAYNQTLHWSPTPEDGATFTFDGYQLTYVYSKAWNRGKAVITIDGNNYGDVDLFWPSVVWGQCISYDLPPGIHTVNITVANRKNPASNNFFVDVDRLIVNDSCGGGGGG